VDVARAPIPDRLRGLHGGDQVIAAFKAVGATQPVRLKPAGKQLLFHVVETWLGEVNVNGLPLASGTSAAHWRTSATGASSTGKR
jgi:hypothetical protein